MTVAIIAGHAFLELVVGKMGNQLREDGSAAFIRHCSAKSVAAPIPTDSARF
jgi:hypothetical protein